MKPIDELRQWMRREHLQVTIIPTNDCHFGEYVPAYFKVREWLSGFTGSAGTLAVTLSDAALWTDSRYFIQAARQLEGSGIVLMKQKVAGTPTIAQWINEKCRESQATPASFAVGLDGDLFTADEVEDYRAQLGGIPLTLFRDPFDTIWAERPQLTFTDITLMPERYAGMSVRDKYLAVRNHLCIEGEFAMFVTACDEVMWLCNLRANDVEYNPVALSYCILDNCGITLFCKKEKLTREAADYLAAQDVKVCDYDEIDDALSRIPGSVPVIASGGLCSARKMSILKNHPMVKEQVVGGTIAMLRACKNDIQLEWTRKALLEDGICWVKLLKYVYDNYPSGELSEYSITRELLGIKRQSPGYVGESFEPIVAFGPNAAAAHYSFDSEESSAKVTGSGFLLMDLGSHYPYGTTDTTRTIWLGGEIPDELRKDYTLVMKGNIALSQAIFPAGTRGCQLDILARGPMYATGKMYFHGTSHGVGQYLCVHESPQIRMEYNPIPLQEGMVLSNEPAIYVEGSHGIRTENMIAVRHYMTTGFNTFLRFETLTMVPIDLSIVDFTLLSEDERHWVEDFNRTVFETLSPRLEDDEREWLLNYILR
ncbi:MAG: M24 family metallopeptidase [Bacteroidales bacterium]|nr:M24 family metallopeptidase [Bacteroidales bacterium]